MYIFHFIEMQIVKYLNLNINMDLGQFKIIGSINCLVIVNPKKFLIVPGTLCTSKNCALQLYLCKNSILKYKWILRSLKHARFFEHDGAAGVFEIEQVF
jgi:hypothetical protein